MAVLILQNKIFSIYLSKFFKKKQFSYNIIIYKQKKKSFNLYKDYTNLFFFIFYIIFKVIWVNYGFKNISQISSSFYYTFFLNNIIITKNNLKIFKFKNKRLSFRFDPYILKKKRHKIKWKFQQIQYKKKINIIHDRKNNVFKNKHWQNFILRKYYISKNQLNQFIKRSESLQQMIRGIDITKQFNFNYYYLSDVYIKHLLWYKQKFKNVNRVKNLYTFKNNILYFKKNIKNSNIKIWYNDYFNKNLKLTNSCVKYIKNSFFNKYSLWWVFILQFLKKNVSSNSLLKPLSNYFWFSTYLQLYFYKFFGYKLQWYFYNFSNTIKNSKFIIWWHKLYKKKNLKIYFDSPYKFFYILVNLIFFKNIDYFVKLVQRVICKAPLKLHKRYFYHVKTILANILELLQAERKLLGFTIFFKGKLARKGSVRKSIFFYKQGRVSNTNKSLRTSYRQFLVFTETGVVGCYISLFY